MCAARQYLSPDERRLMLLAAARKVVDGKGLDALSIPAVAAEAGASKALVYSFFPGNAALNAAFIAQTIGVYQDALDLVDAETSDGAARAAVVLRALSELPMIDLHVLNAVVHANGRDVLMEARQHLETLTRARWSIVPGFDGTPPALFTIVWLFAGIVVSLAVEVNAGKLRLETAQELLRGMIGTAAGLLPPTD